MKTANILKIFYYAKIFEKNYKNFELSALKI